jgi:hypothetical protein
MTWVGRSAPGTPHVRDMTTAVQFGYAKAHGTLLARGRYLPSGMIFAAI